MGVLLRPRDTLAQIVQGARRNWVAVGLLVLVATALPVLIPLTRTPSVPVGMVPDVGNRGMVGGVSGPVMDGGMNPGMSSGPDVPGALLLAVLRGVGFWLIWSIALQVGVSASRSDMTFGQVWLLVVWCTLPFAARGLLQTAFVFSNQTVGAPGLSGFLGPAPGGVDPFAAILRSVLGSIDLFTVWFLVLLVIGLVASAGLSWRRAALVTSGAGLIFGILGGLLALVFGAA